MEQVKTFDRSRFAHVRIAILMHTIDKIVSLMGLPVSSRQSKVLSVNKALLLLHTFVCALCNMLIANHMQIKAKKPTVCFIFYKIQNIGQNIDLQVCTKSLVSLLGVRVKLYKVGYIEQTFSLYLYNILYQVSFSTFSYFRQKSLVELRKIVKPDIILSC